MLNHEELKYHKASIELRMAEYMVECEVIKRKQAYRYCADPRNPEGQILLQGIEELVSCNYLVHLSRDVFIVISEAKSRHTKLLISPFQIGEIFFADPPDASDIARYL
jgi:hypothetical protein